MRVLAICGSLRRDSWNRKLLRLAIDRLKTKRVDVEEFDLTPVPIFNQDVEAQGVPQAAGALREAFKGSDAVVIASPEYNGVMSAAIKNAVEWASRPPENLLRDRVFFVMGTGPGRSGAKGMYPPLCFSIETEGGWVVPSPRVLLPNIDQIISPDGKLIDESVGGLLDLAMDKLLETANRFAVKN